MINEQLRKLFEGYPKNKETIIASMESFLYKGNTDLNTDLGINDNKWRPIHYAAYYQDEDLFRYLVAKNADVDPLTANEKNVYHLILQQPKCPKSMYALLDKIIPAFNKAKMRTQRDSRDNVPYHYLGLQTHPDLYQGSEIIIFKGHKLNEELSVSFSASHLLTSASVERSDSIKIQKETIQRAIDEKNYGFIAALYKVMPGLVSPFLPDIIAHKEKANGSGIGLIVAIRQGELEFLDAVQRDDYVSVLKVIRQNKVFISCLDDKGNNALFHTQQNEDSQIRDELVKNGVESLVAKEPRLKPRVGYKAPVSSPENPNVKTRNEKGGQRED